MTVAVLQRLEAQRVIPVIRAADVDDAVATTRACARAGMSVVELTRATPGVERALHALRPDDLVLGLGTVTRAEHVRAAATAGARFVVSFAGGGRMIEAAVGFGLTPIPGALTPTEILRCRHAGAPAVKIFPARLVEPAYLDDLHALMPDLRALVTGGVAASADAIRPWLAAGALAVGIGSGLGTAASVGEQDVERRASALLDAAVGARE